MKAIRTAICWLGMAMAASAATPLQLGPFPGGTNDDVYGIRLGLLPENRDVYGVSIGLLRDRIKGDGGGVQLATFRNDVAGDFTGWRLALLNTCSGTMSGMEAGLSNGAWDTNAIEHAVRGLQLGGLGNAADEMCGAQVALGFVVPAHGGLAPIGVNRARDARGVQVVGLGVNYAEELRGIQFSFANGAHAGNGVQIALGLNISHEFDGLQVGAINDCGGVNMEGQPFDELNRHVASEEGLSRGLQIAFLGNAARRFSGAQLALIVNGAVRELQGVQVGTINYAGQATGLQVGFINWANQLHGVQIGALNIVRDSSPGFLPLVNARF